MPPQTKRAVKQSIEQLEVFDEEEVTFVAVKTPSTPGSSSSSSKSPANVVKSPKVGTPGSVDECVICMELLADAPYVGTLPSCKHTFCFTCISSWSNQETTCPLCKAEFKSISKKMGKIAATKAISAAADTAGDDNKITGRKRKSSSQPTVSPKATTVKVAKKSQAEKNKKRRD